MQKNIYAQDIVDNQSPTVGFNWDWQTDAILLCRSDHFESSFSLGSNITLLD